MLSMSIIRVCVNSCSQGGMEIQVNVVDRYILLKAQEGPDKYQDLMARIAGAMA